MPDAENAVGHAYTEYGVLVDRTSAGLGVFLAETTRDLERAERLASRSPEAWGYPAEVKARRVYVTDWTSRPSDHEPCCNTQCDEHGHFLKPVKGPDPDADLTPGKAVERGLNDG